MAVLSQHRRDSVPQFPLPGPRGLRLSRPFPAVWAPPGRVAWRDWVGGGSSPGTAAWTESGPRVTRRGGVQPPCTSGGGHRSSGLACGRNRCTGLELGPPTDTRALPLPPAQMAAWGKASPAFLLRPRLLTP